MISLLISGELPDLNFLGSVVSTSLTLVLMDLKAPQCQCGNGLMVLRVAGDYSTHPGHRYYICPFDIRHRDRFFWYDEYHGRNVPSSGDCSNKTESMATNCEDRSCDSSSSIRFKKKTMNSSHTPYVSPSNQTPPSFSNTYFQSEPAMSSTTYETRNPPLRSIPCEREFVCWCFGFICALICVSIVLMLAFGKK